MNYGKREQLKKSIDSLIEKYGDKDPELVKSLLHLRKELEVSTAEKLIDITSTLYRIASWAKTIFEHWPT